MSGLSVLLPYQQKWLADNSPVKVWEKSRRIGATWAEAADAVLIAGKKKGGMDYYYTSVNEQLSREFIRDATAWAQEFDIAIADVGETLLKDGEKAIRVQQILFASGKKIMGLPSNPRSGKKIMGLPSNPSALRGRQGVYLADEQAFVENPEENLKAAMAFLMWGGKVRILSTHNGEDSHFNEIIKNIRAGRVKYSLHRTTLDDALQQGLFQRICQKNEQGWSLEKQETWREELVNFYGDGSDEELFCIPNSSSGAYFPRILVERAMDDSIPVLNLSLKDEFVLQPQEEKTSHVGDWLEEIYYVLSLLDSNLKTSFGFDFGRSGDLSYLIAFQELPNLVRKAAFALELRNVPFTEQEQILFAICDRLPRFIGGSMDARGNGAYLAEKAADRYGHHRIDQVKLTLQWYLENMPKYKAALEDKKVLLPANSDLLDDHRMVQVIKGVPKIPDTKNKGSDGRSRHGDGAIACVLAWAASCQENENAQPALGSFVFNNWEMGAIFKRQEIEEAEKELLQLEQEYQGALPLGSEHPRYTTAGSISLQEWRVKLLYGQLQRLENRFDDVLNE